MRHIRLNGEDNSAGRLMPGVASRGGSHERHCGGTIEQHGGAEVCVCVCAD